MRLPHWLVVLALVFVAYVLWRKYAHRVTSAVTAATK